MKKLISLLILFFTFSVSAQVKLGVDVLREDNFAQLQGKRVGLVCHPASVDSRLVSTIDLLRQTDQCKLAALFGPEHGVYGDVYAGGEVGDTTDPRTGVPAYSLYGKVHDITPERASKIDVVVFDLQDIGSRSYTFINTMKNVLKNCNDRDLPLIILDRPNPLGGQRIEGPPTVEKGYESGISSMPIPYVHGMTMGELAQLARDLYVPNYKKLTVIKMKGWKREMTWNETGLKWVPTSPQIPTVDAAFGYAATGFLGELGQLSNGCGYTLPFTVVGAPWIDGDKMYDTLIGATNRSPGATLAPDPTIQYRAIRYQPFFATFEKKACQGVQIFIDPHKTSNLVEINFRMIDAVGAKALFDKAAALDAAATKPKTHYTRSWDLTCGSDAPRKWVTSGKPMQQLFDQWRAADEKFRQSREKYLLY